LVACARWRGALGVGALLAALVVGCASRPAAPTAGIDRSAIDAGVRPQDDFFGHVNGTWLKTATIPPERSRIGGFVALRERTEGELLAIIEDAAKGPRDDDERRIAALYRSFMDEGAAERAGLAPLAGELAAIDQVATGDDVAAAIGRLDRLGARAPLALAIALDARDATRWLPTIGQSGLLLPDRDYYLVADEPRFVAARAACVAYLARLLALAGASDAAQQADAVFALETALARAQWTRVAARDPVRTYNKVGVDALAGVDARFAWPPFLAATGVAGRIDEVVVREPSYVTALAAAIAATPIPVWKAYLRTRLLDAYAPYLGNDFVAARFAFAGTALSGTPENLARWRRGVALVQQSLGDALGRLYVARHHPARSQHKMEVLVDNLFAAYRESIASLDWMSEATRREASAKLAAFQRKIGHPKTWIDYRTLELRADDLAGNVARARAFEHARQLARLGKPVDRDEWRITPQTVNAFYSASFNEIVFPAAILRPPFFDPDADDAVNYGAIGAIIGHEISHGFDHRGSQYDGSGNLRVWWTGEDRKRFEAKTKVLVEQYSAFAPLAGQHVDGELTLGENIADNSGLEIAYKAYRRSLGGREAAVIDGTTGDQRFFYGYAQAMRGKSRDEALLAQLRSDPHSPPVARVNGAVRNHPAFYATFGVRPGDGMYLAPEERVSIW